MSGGNKPCWEMREINEFEKGGWCGVEIQAEEHFQRCWNHQPAPALVPQCWERILQEFCVLSLPQFSIADLLKYLIIVCVVGFFGSSVFLFLFFTYSHRLFVKSPRLQSRVMFSVFWEGAVFNVD